MDSDKARENRLRRWAGRLGYEVRKDRARRWGLHHQGGYMVVWTSRNACVQGSDFECSLDDVESYLRYEEANLKAEQETA